MDNKSLYQNFLDEELMDIEISKERWIFQHLENEVMNDEFEKVDESTFSQICKSLENEVLETNKMHISTLIQSLEDEGMVNSQFRSVYLLKKDQSPSFFWNLVFNFFRDALSVIRSLIKTLESSSAVDFDLLNMYCLKLKGSSSCVGACTLMNGCCVFIEAVDKKSKDECLQAARNLNQAYHELHSKFKSLMKLEKEIVSAEETALGLK